MQSGTLRHRICLQKPPDATADPFATAVPQWTTYAQLWASIKPLTSKEVYQVGLLQMKASHTVTIRYPGSSITVSAGDRILFGQRVFELQTGIENPEERNVTLVLTAFEINPSR